jgi:hypothetical protein
MVDSCSECVQGVVHRELEGAEMTTLIEKARKLGETGIRVRILLLVAFVVAAGVCLDLVQRYLRSSTDF